MTMTQRNQVDSCPLNPKEGAPLDLDSNVSGPTRTPNEPQAGSAAAKRATRLVETARTLLALGNEPAACDALEEATRLGRAEAAFAAAVLLLSGDRADPPRGLELLRFAAARGSKEATVMLGEILWSTEGSRQEGVELLRAAAEAGEAEALYVLGLACFRGQGVEKDLAAARELQLAAAMRGLPDAQFELSLLLALGLGGEVDAEGARRWEAKAAKAGHPRACLNRGARLANGKRPDWGKVAYWYARAAAAGNAEAAARLSRMTDQEKTSENVMTGGSAEKMTSSVKRDAPQQKRRSAAELGKRLEEAPSESNPPSKPPALVPGVSVAAPQINAAAAPPAPKRDAEVSLRASKVDVEAGLEQGKPTDKRLWRANDSRFSALLSRH
jgi:uncharacterized protein